MRPKSTSGISFVQFLWLMTVIGVFCVIYVTAHYSQLSKKKVTINAPSVIYNYSFRFPMSSCGDKTAGGTNTWYPVYVEYDEARARTIRQYFCCDAFYDSSVNLIQIASFYNRSMANEFVKVMKANKFDSARVGSGRLITTYPSFQHNNCR